MEGILDISKYPSITATTPHKAVSDKYQVISTKSVLDVLDSIGWKPVNILERKARVNDRKGVQKHMVRVRHVDNLNTSKELHEVFPELVLTNSHDRSCSFTIRLGLYRLICANGLIVADSVFEMHTLRHIGEVEKEVKKAVDSVIDIVPQIAAKINTLQKFEMNEELSRAFALKVLQLRYPRNDIVDELYRYNFDELLRPLRSEDSKLTLWNVLNILQEKMTQGTQAPYINTERQNGTMSLRRGKRMRNIDHLIGMNQGIWNVAEDFLQAA